MIKGNKRKLLTSETILNLISPFDIFKFYMPNNWEINIRTNSPFRTDKDPSFLIGYRDNHLIFKDFGDSEKKGNCFKFVMLMYNISHYEALCMIDKDFGLNILSPSTKNYKRIISEYKQPLIINKKETIIQVKTRAFTLEELAYWNEYYQDINDLKANNVYSIDKLYLNKERFPLKETELRFGYLYNGKWKIYSPFADKKNKWLPNNVPITAMDGLEDIKNCDVAFIQKSKKDYLVMKKIFPCCCAVQNEGIGCFSKENVNYLKENSNRQILSFDSDEPGVKNSIIVTEKFGFEYCNVPKIYLKEGINDWASLAKEKGLKTVENYLKEKMIL